LKRPRNARALPENLVNEDDRIGFTAALELLLLRAAEAGNGDVSRTSNREFGITGLTFPVVLFVA
jgi:hypothetical protein